MKPAILLPSDTLIHRADPKTFADRIIEGVEAWGEWTGATGEDTQACHVEGIYDAERIAKMNPPASCLYAQAAAPWDDIIAYRLDLSQFFGLGIPKFPATDPTFCAAFRAECDAHLNEPYGWDSIIHFGWAGILAHLNPAWGHWLLARRNPEVAMNGHGAVCSIWWTDRIEKTVQKFYGLPTFDLFAGCGIGEDEERPADYPRSPYLSPIRADGSA